MVLSYKPAYFEINPTDDVGVSLGFEQHDNSGGIANASSPQQWCGIILQTRDGGSVLI